MRCSLRRLTVMLFVVSISVPVLAAAGEKKSSSSAARPFPVKILAEVDIPNDGSDLITVPITLKNRTYRFLLGMANSSSVYDVSLRDQLGEPALTRKVNVRGGKYATLEFFRPPAVKIGQLNITTNSLVACADLKSYRRFQRLPVYGVLGADFLRRYVVRLDFDRGKLAILSAAPPDSGTVIPIRTTSHAVPLIGVKFAGQPASDCALGSSLFSTALLHPDRFDKMVAEQNVHPADAPGNVPLAFGRFHKQGGTLNRIAIGGSTFRDVSVLRGQIVGKFDAVGLKFLARYRVTVDVPNKVLYLKKRNGVDRTREKNLSGLEAAINFQTNRIVVQKVAAGSAAANAGFETGDVIARINGQDSHDVSIFRLRDLLGNPGRVGMFVKRGNEVLSRTMFLKRK